MLTGDDRDSIAELRERLRRLETAVDASGLGVWEWDVRSGALAWNARNRELYGVAHDDPLTITDYPELVHPDDRALVEAAYRAASEQPEGGFFSSEHRTLATPDGKPRWVLTQGRVTKDAAGIRMAVGSNLDITDRKTAEERRSLVASELAHRFKNGIVIIMTIVAQTAKSAQGVEDFERVLMARLRALADSQDLVTAAAGKPLRLGDLLTRALNPFDLGRFDIDPALGEISIPGELAVAMALLLHEMSTNAVKYGALSAPAGRVRVARAGDGDGKVRLAWIEQGGPEVKPVTRRGFGSRLLDISLRNNGGHVVARFAPAGFQADVYIPSPPD